MTVTVDTTPMDRPAWLDWRRGGIGGSDIGALLGLSRWASPWSLWADKVGLTGEQDENDEMVGGRWLELAVGPWFTDRTGLHLTFQQARCTSGDRPWMRCTLDGAAADHPNLDDLAAALGVVQIKTGERGADWDEVPAVYQAQCQWEMAVTGLGHAWLPMLHGRRLQVYEVPRDQADIDFMVERAEQFWTDHVLAQVPPPSDGSDATLTAMGDVWPQETPGLAVDITDLAPVLDELDQAKADKAAAATREKAAKARIVEALADAEVGLIDGQVAVTCKAQSRTDIDAARLKRAMPDVFAELSTSTSFRVLRPKKRKAA